MSTVGTLNDRTRQELALLTARIMTESGLHWHEARTKAARRLGVNLLTRNLPDEREIKAALTSQQALFEPDHDANIAHLRAAALQAMQLLRHFEPVLTGSVADGTATAHADIELVLRADSEKDVELVLLNAGVGYRAIKASPKGGAVFRCEDRDPVVELTILGPGRPRQTGDGRQPSSARLGLAELNALLEAE